MLLLAGAFAALPRVSEAQLTIQQPVFGVNSVATTVSVPDRGRAFLGGVSRAGESRTSFGPLRSGTNTGLFREHSGMSVTATIHDFDEMDRQLLSRASAGATAKAPFHVDDPYQQLLARTQRRGQALTTSAADVPFRGTISPAGDVPRSVPVAEERPPAPAPKFGADGGATFFELGRDAEDRGKPGVAKVHYRAAAKRGHADAQVRLAELEGSARPANVAAAK
jgi:hypothetical protein